MFTVDEVKRTHRQFQGAPQKAKDTFVLVILSRAILELQGLVNGSDFAIPCFVRLWVITHAFCYIHNIGDTRLKRRQKLSAQKVCFLEQQGNVCGVPWTICSAETNECVVEYIGTYPAVNDLPTLAASRGRANNAPTYMYLPASASFVVVHGDYSKAQGSEESASLSTFRQIGKSTTRTSSL